MIFINLFNNFEEQTVRSGSGNCHAKPPNVADAHSGVRQVCVPCLEGPQAHPLC